MSTIKGKVLEHGGFWPEIGEYVSDGDDLYVIEGWTHGGRIETAQQGSGGSDCMYADFVQVGWDKLKRGDEYGECIVLGYHPGSAGR